MISAKSFSREGRTTGLHGKSEMRNAVNGKTYRANSKCKGAFLTTADVKINGMPEESEKSANITY